MAMGLFTVLRDRNARVYLTGVIVSGLGTRPCFWPPGSG